MDRWRAAGALLALAACIASSVAAPTSSNDQTALDLIDEHAEGCYYNFQHYGEGDRIMTNEPCLNCTCHNRMLMCYLRVCPFTKAIGQDCTVEKRADQCCPIVTCPDVPVDLLTSTSTTSPAEYGGTGVGKVDNYGCTINGRYFAEGSKVPQTPGKPCEHCYCIRNMTTCVMQECTLHVDGCTPIYHKDVCCPVRYFCDHPEDEMPLLDDMTTTVRPTPGFLLTTTEPSATEAATTTLPPRRDCMEGDHLYPDGALIKTEKPCEHCYCMKGDIVCVVQECGTPMENEGKNCTSMPPREGQCCPDTYICEGDDLSTEAATESSFEELTTITPPRRVSIEGSGYRNTDEIPFTEIPTFATEIEGSGEEEPEQKPADTVDKLKPEIGDHPGDNTLSPIDEGEFLPKSTQTPIFEEAGHKTTNLDSRISDEESSKPTEHSKSTPPTSSQEEEEEKRTTPTSEADANLKPSLFEQSTETLDEKVSEPPTASVQSTDTTDISEQKIPDEQSSDDKETTSKDEEKPTSPSVTMEYDIEVSTKLYTEIITEVPQATELPSVIEHDIVTDLEVDKESTEPSILTTTLDDIEKTVATSTKESEISEDDTRRKSPETEPTVISAQEAISPSVVVSEKSTESPTLEQTTTKEKNDVTESAPINEQNIIQIDSEEEQSSDSPILDKTTSVNEPKTPENIDEQVPTTSAPKDSTELSDIEKTTSDIKVKVPEMPGVTRVADEMETLLTTVMQAIVTTEPAIKKEDEVTGFVEISTLKDAKEPTDDQQSATINYETSSLSAHPDQELELTTAVTKQQQEPKKPETLEELGTTLSHHVTESPTTESIMELSTFAHIEHKEPVTETLPESEITFTTSAPEKIESPETTTINPEDNEIAEVPSPGRIPGEGDCLLEGITYKNDSIVPNNNKCHTGCRCVSSIIKCDPILCSPPPEYMDNCQPMYDTPESCCPTFICDHGKETIPPQSHSQMSGTESPTPSPTIECNGDQCEVVDTKQPSEIPSLAPDKVVVSDCSSEGCTVGEQTPISYQPEHPAGCLGDKCSLPSEDCTDGKCEPLVPDSQEPTIAVPAKEFSTSCEGESCIRKPDITPAHDIPQGCTTEEECKRIQSLPSTEPICEGQSCKNIKEDCSGSECKITTSQTSQQEGCSGESGCQLPTSDTEQEVLPALEGLTTIKSVEESPERVQTSSEEPVTVMLLSTEFEPEKHATKVTEQPVFTENPEITSHEQEEQFTTLPAADHDENPTGLPDISTKSPEMVTEILDHPSSVTEGGLIKPELIPETPVLPDEVSPTKTSPVEEELPEKGNRGTETTTIITKKTETKEPEIQEETTTPAFVRVTEFETEVKVTEPQDTDITKQSDIQKLEYEKSSSMIPLQETTTLVEGYEIKVTEQIPAKEEDIPQTHVPEGETTSQTWIDTSEPGITVASEEKETESPLALVTEAHYKDVEEKRTTASGSEDIQKTDKPEITKPTVKESEIKPQEEPVVVDKQEHEPPVLEETSTKTSVQAETLTTVQKETELDSSLQTKEPIQPSEKSTYIPLVTDGGFEKVTESYEPSVTDEYEFSTEEPKRPQDELKLPEVSKLPENEIYSTEPEYISIDDDHRRTTLTLHTQTAIVLEEKVTEISAPQEKSTEYPTGEQATQLSVLKEGISETPVIEVKVTETPAFEEKSTRVPDKEEKTTETPNLTEETLEKVTEVPVMEEKATDLPNTEEEATEVTGDDEKLSEKVTAPVPEEKMTNVPVQDEKTTESFSLIEEKATTAPQEITTELPISGTEQPESPSLEMITRAPILEEKVTESFGTEVKATDKPVAEEKVTNTPILEETPTLIPGTEEKATEVPIIEENVTVFSVFDKETTDSHFSVEKATEISIMEETTTLSPISEDMATEISAMATETLVKKEESTGAPELETKTTKSSTIDEKVTEISVTEAIVTETPSSEEKVTEGPGTEIKETSTPIINERATEVPSIETKETEVSIVEEKATEGPVTQTKMPHVSVMDEKVTEVSVTKATEASAIEEKVTEGPIMETKTTDASAIKERATEGSISKTAVTPVPEIEEKATEGSETEATSAPEEKETEVSVTEAIAIVTPVLKEGSTKIPPIEENETESILIDEMTKLPVLEEKTTQVPTVDKKETVLPVSNENIPMTPVPSEKATDIPIEKATETPTVDQMKTEPSDDKTSEKPFEDKKSTELPATETPFLEEKSTMAPVFEEKATEPPILEVMSTESPTAEEKATGVPEDRVPEISEGSEDKVKVTPEIITQYQTPEVSVTVTDENKSESTETPTIEDLIKISELATIVPTEEKVSETPTIVQDEKDVKGPETVTEAFIKVTDTQAVATEIPEIVPLEEETQAPEIITGAMVTEIPSEEKKTVYPEVTPAEKTTRIPEAEIVTTEISEISSTLKPEYEVTQSQKEDTKAPTSIEITTSESEKEIPQKTDTETNIQDGPVSKVPEIPSSEPQTELPLEQPVDTELFTETSPELTISESPAEKEKETTRTPRPELEISETTPYLVELEEHTHKIYDDLYTLTPSEELPTVHFEGQEPTSEAQRTTEKLPTEGAHTATPVDESNISDQKQDIPTDQKLEIQPTESPAEESPEKSTKPVMLEEETTNQAPSDSILTDRYGPESGENKKPSTPKQTFEEDITSAPVFQTEKPFEDVPMHPVKEVTAKPQEVPAETTAPEEEFIPVTTRATTSNVEEEPTTPTAHLDKTTKPEEIPGEVSTSVPEVSKPDESQPTDDIPSPEEDGHFPPSGGYNPEPDYMEEDQAFGPGTCRYGGKVYVSAQQIPRDDPCDFCFCFRSDIICLQQSCPPPIHGCHEEPIQGFCCPRYECPVSMATTLNITTTTTTTTTTLPPHFLPHAYKGAAQRRGCQIKGHTYKVGEVVRASSGPCLHCTCGGDGQMKCDPKACTPEPMLRQMIAAAVSAKRRR